MCSSDLKDIGNVVAAVRVRHGTFNNSRAQVKRPAGIVVDVKVQSLKLAVLVDTNLVFAKERVALAHGDHVFLSCQHASHRATGLLGRQGNGGTEDDGARFLATEATTKPLDANNNLVAGNVEHARSKYLPVFLISIMK